MRRTRINKEIKSGKSFNVFRIHGQTQDINTFHLPTLGKLSKSEREMMRKLFFSSLWRAKKRSKKSFVRFCLEPRAPNMKTETGKKVKGKLLFGMKRKAKKSEKLFEFNLNIVYFLHLLKKQ